MPDVYWLERELSRQLAPVTAPESLWGRINRPQPARRNRVSLGWVFWPCAAALAVLIFSTIVLKPGSGQGPQRLREQELTMLVRSSAGYDFRSDSLQDARAWVKAESNIDIDLPSRQAAREPRAVQLLGVRMVRLRGLPVAAIHYRVGDEVATLFVSGKQPALSGNTEASKHLFSRMTTAGNARIFSWNMRNQTYAISYSGTENSRGACLLCHASMPG